ncbi:MAG: hypothetical protein KC613_28350, partial [Myxococcales bacterium]|nr:hypothetical protein [Myxococcales bacterium]
LTALGGLRLADLGPGDRLDELAFVLPVQAAIDGARLAQVMTAHPGPGLPPGYREHLAALPAAPVRGFLSGSVDLVCRHAGRWYAMDYKTNRLGGAPSDYTPDRVERAMVDGHYVLQAHLYAVALHRFLTVRLGTAYDPHAHLGGLAWLFLRGMHPDHPPGTGVWAHTPPVARIEALSACLGDPPKPAPVGSAAAQLNLGLG